MFYKLFSFLIFDQFGYVFQMKKFTSKFEQFNGRAKKRKLHETIEQLKSMKEIKVHQKGSRFILLPYRKRKQGPKMTVDLPNELWLRIFSYLPTETILGSLSLVSKRFNSLTQDPTLIKTIMLNGIDKYDLEQVTKVITRSCKCSIIFSPCQSL